MIKHEEICSELTEIYYRKNADYGSSFDTSIGMFGLVAGAVRIGDKMNRLANLLRNEAQVKDESIEDTLLDMANYCIMTAMYMRNKKK